MAISWLAWMGIVVGCILAIVLMAWFVASRIYSRSNVAAQQFDPTGPLPQPIDLPDYTTGTWYEIARYPQWFERNCKDVTARYTTSPDGSSDAIRVENTCTDKTTGETRTAVGTAYPTERDGVLAVSFFPGVYGNYTVVKREPRLSIVSNPERSSLWVLSRDRTLEPQQWDAITDWLNANQFNTQRLVMN